MHEINTDKITLLDIGRERMMHRKAWDITPKNIYQAMHLMLCLIQALIW
ncbi:hypothetical protein [Vibrio sp. J502]